MKVSVKLARNSFFHFWATLVTAGSSLVLSVVLARGLGPEEYGSYSFAIWLLTLGAMLANLGLNSMSNKFIAEYQGAGDQQKVLGVLRLALRGRALAAVVIALALVPVSMVLIRDHSTPETRYFPLLISVALVPYAMHQGFLGVLRGFQRYDYSSYVLLAVLPLKTVLAVVLIWLGYGILHLLFLEVFTWTMAAVLGLVLMRRQIGPRPAAGGDGLSKETRGTLVRYAVIAMALLLVDFILNQRSENFFLKVYWSDKEVGFYNIAFAVSSYPMLLVPGVLGQVLVPAISEQFGRKDTGRLAAIYVNSARYLMALAFPLAAGGAALARPLVIAMFGEPYEEVILPTQVLFLGSAVFATSFSTTGIIMGTNRPGFLLVKSLFVVPASIGLALALIPRYGVVGAAVSHTLGLMFFPVTVWYVSTRFKVRWPIGDTVRIALASLGMAACVFLLTHYLQALWLLPVAILLGVGVYLSLLLLLRVPQAQDWEMLISLQDRYGLTRNLARIIRWLPVSGLLQSTGIFLATSRDMQKDRDKRGLV